MSDKKDSYSAQRVLFDDVSTSEDTWQEGKDGYEWHLEFFHMPEFLYPFPIVPAGTHAKHDAVGHLSNDGRVHVFNPGIIERLVRAGLRARSFAPADVLTFIARTLQAGKPDGSEIYSHLDRIVYFSVNPREVTSDGIGLNFWLPAYRHQNDKTIADFLENFRQAWFQYYGELFGAQPIQISGKDQPFKGTWTNGLHGLRIRT